MPNSSQFPAGEPRLSRRLSALFPAGAVAVELEGPGDPGWLLPQEAEAMARAVPKRVCEFAAGRRCARRALAEFGLGGAAIPVAPDRRPIWPAAVVGSITHTAGLCAAVVASVDRLCAIGMDCEQVEQVGAELWETICTPAEARWVDRLAPDERARAVALLFSAKEAFYKCQSPLTGEWLDFHDLVITPEDWGGATGAFLVVPARPLDVSRTAPAPWRGRYCYTGGIVATGVGLERPAAQGRAQ